MSDTVSFIVRLPTKPEHRARMRAMLKGNTMMASQQAAFIVGTELIVDGGMSPL
jgi:hypothetical protein